MDATLLARYDRPVPRYTSYPTAPHFHAGVSAATYRDWLAALDPRASLSLYLHVPFCEQLCWYCGCNMSVVNGYAPVAAYADLLRREIDLIAAALPGRMAVRHLHWGGGTPTILSADDIRALMRQIRRRFALADDAEIAVESDPRHLPEDKVAALADVGVTRVSLGVQDVNPAVQRAVNRVQPQAVTEAAVARLRAAGIARINLDLMYGLPGQDVAGVERTVDAAVALKPDRLALFGYAHVPWMKRHQRLLDEASLPDAPARYAQAEAAADRLQAQGYRRIGLDHFAAQDDSLVRARDAGRLRRNFQGYTDDPADALIGLGASAIGALPQGYVQNAARVPEYRAALADGALPTVRGIALDADDRLRRAVIERLMCDLAVDLAALAGEHGAAVQDFADDLAGLAAEARDGLVAIDGWRLRITARGRPFMRLACAAFDRYLERGAGRHARAV